MAGRRHRSVHGRGWALKRSNRPGFVRLHVCPSNRGSWSCSSHRMRSVARPPFTSKLRVLMHTARRHPVRPEARGPPHVLIGGTNHIKPRPAQAVQAYGTYRCTRVNVTPVSKSQLPTKNRQWVYSVLHWHLLRHSRGRQAVNHMKHSPTIAHRHPNAYGTKTSHARPRWAEVLGFRRRGPRTQPQAPLKPRFVTRPHARHTQMKVSSGSGGSSGTTAPPWKPRPSSSAYALPSAHPPEAEPHSSALRGRSEERQQALLLGLLLRLRLRRRRRRRRPLLLLVHESAVHVVPLVADAHEAAALHHLVHLQQGRRSWTSVDVCALGIVQGVRQPGPRQKAAKL